MTAVSLPVRLDTAAAAALATVLQEQLSVGTTLELEASGVDVVGLASLQVIASARATALAAGSGFRLVTPSEAMRDACRLAGLGLLLEPITEGSPA